MFRVSLSYNTLQDEIGNLQTKKNNRDEALTLSKNELNDDHRRVMNLVQKVTNQKRDKENYEKTMHRKRTEKEEIIRKYDANFQFLSSEIDKNLEQVE